MSGESGGMDRGGAAAPAVRLGWVGVVIGTATASLIGGCGVVRGDGAGGGPIEPAGGLADGRAASDPAPSRLAIRRRLWAVSDSVLSKAVGLKYGWFD